MKNRVKLLLFVGLWLGFTGAWAQVNRYVVHFSDKDGTPFTIENPSEYLSQKAILRRQNQGIEIFSQDLPVNPSYVQQVSDISPDVFVYYTSKWMNNVLVQCNVSDVVTLEFLSFVKSVEYVAPGSKLTPQVNLRSPGLKNQRKRNRKSSLENTDIQNEMLGIDIMHESGFTGQGMDIAIMDGGFEGVNGISHFDHMFSNGRIKYTYDYVTNGIDVYKYSDHGTKVLSLMGGYTPGEYVGGAFDANYYLFVTEDVCNSCEHRIEEYNWVYAAEFADSAGVDVFNTSLGYNIFEDPSMDYVFDDMDGKTAIISIASTIAASKGILVVASAGNEGSNSWGYITPPADANDILSIGNVDLMGQRWRTSSHGFSADGRIKPELAGPGTGVAVINKSGNIVGGSGTSFSSSIVAGLVAGTWQANPGFSAADLRFFLTRSANNAALPDSLTGYGIPNFESLMNLLSFAKKDSNFTLFPNPVDDDLLIIRVNNPDEAADTDLKIFDVQGNLIMETKLTFGWQQLTQTIDIQTLKAGMYILNLAVGNEIDKIRIVKI